MLGGKLDLIVGTPGRLADMIRDQTIRTQNVSQNLTSTHCISHTPSMSGRPRAKLRLAP